MQIGEIKNALFSEMPGFKTQVNYLKNSLYFIRNISFYKAVQVFNKERFYSKLKFLFI